MLYLSCTLFSFSFELDEMNMLGNFQFVVSKVFEELQKMYGVTLRYARIHIFYHDYLFVMAINVIKTKCYMPSHFPKRK